MNIRYKIYKAIWTVGHFIKDIILPYDQFSKVYKMFYDKMALNPIIYAEKRHNRVWNEAIEHPCPWFRYIPFLNNIIKWKYIRAAERTLKRYIDKGDPENIELIAVMIEVNNAKTYSMLHADSRSQLKRNILNNKIRIKIECAKDCLRRAYDVSHIEDVEYWIEDVVESMEEAEEWIEEAEYFIDKYLVRGL